MEEEIIKTDVLCVGGGIAGLMAAIRAGELGAKVVVAEKGNTLSSGAGGCGNDHFECYIPEVHGPDMEIFLKDLLRGQKSERLYDIERLRAHFAKTFEIVKLWDSWGIPMRYEGKWEFAGHAFPGHTRCYLKYAGRVQKEALTRQALDRGVKIMNRVMVFDLLRDGDKVVGAVGVHTREDKLLVFQAKTVILGTGGWCARLYPGPVPNLLFNLNNRPTCTGDGRAMAYRAGVELQNMELPQRHIGVKYFARTGQATWIGIFRDPEGKPIGPFLTGPDRRYHDMMGETNKLFIEQYTKAGKGPIYMDGAGMSDDDYEYMNYWMRNEGNAALIDHLEAEGIDHRKNPIEFMTYHIRINGQIRANGQTETALKGLYAAGDEASGGISEAATSGWTGGENAAKNIQKMEAPDVERARANIEETKELLGQLRVRQNGPVWQEANIAVQQTMGDYAGSVRYANLLKAGLNHLRRLREKAYATMMARNQHELGRCLEVLNMFDIGEAILVMAEDRKESRALHVRPDYPYTNPLLNKFHTVRKVGNKLVTEWREGN
ncbi:FAD-binding protein [Chloroflexota bacterium]